MAAELPSDLIGLTREQKDLLRAKLAYLEKLESDLESGAIDVEFADRELAATMAVIDQVIEKGKDQAKLNSELECSETLGNEVILDELKSNNSVEKLVKIPTKTYEPKQITLPTKITTTSDFKDENKQVKKANEFYQSSSDYDKLL